MTVTDMASRRQPVTYTVHITQHWDGSVEVFVEGISDDQRSRDSAAEAMLEAAALFANGKVETAHDPQ